MDLSERTEGSGKKQRLAYGSTKSPVEGCERWEHAQILLSQEVPAIPTKGSHSWELFAKRPRPPFALGPRRSGRELSAVKVLPVVLIVKCHYTGVHASLPSNRQF